MGTLHYISFTEIDIVLLQQRLILPSSVQITIISITVIKNNLEKIC